MSYAYPFRLSFILDQAYANFFFLILSLAYICQFIYFSTFNLFFHITFVYFSLTIGKLFLIDKLFFCQIFGYC